jgi:hypothetical protein
MERKIRFNRVRTQFSYSKLDTRGNRTQNVPRATMLPAGNLELTKIPSGVKNLALDSAWSFFIPQDDGNDRLLWLSYFECLETLTFVEGRGLHPRHMEGSTCSISRVGGEAWVGPKGRFRYEILWKEQLGWEAVYLASTKRNIERSKQLEGSPPLRMPVIKLKVVLLEDALEFFQK